MTTPTYQGPTFDLPINRTSTFNALCYEADQTTELITQSSDGWRFKVWAIDGAAPDIDADNVAMLTDTFTVDAGTEVFTSTSDHGLVVGDAVHFSNSGGALPTPLEAETAYWVITTPASDTFTISTSKGGSVLDITGTGTGTHTWTQVKSRISVVSNGSVGVPSQVNIICDQVDTAQLTADTDYNYELALVDDDDGNRIKTITRGTFRTDGSPTGDIGLA